MVVVVAVEVVAVVLGGEAEVKAMLAWRGPRCRTAGNRVDDDSDIDGGRRRGGSGCDDHSRSDGQRHHDAKGSAPVVQAVNHATRRRTKPSEQPLALTMYNWLAPNLTMAISL